MATWSYLDWIGQNLRWGAARLVPGVRARVRRRFDWRGLFGRQSGERVAATHITSEAVSRPLGEASQPAYSDRVKADLQARIGRMRRAAVMDMFDQVGLAPFPGQLWRFVDADRDPGAGVSNFLRAIGIDPALITARDADEIERANEVLELLFSIDHVFDRIAPELAVALEARLCSGDYATVRLAAKVVKTFETIARMESRWPPEVRLGVLDAFVETVRAGLANPLAVRAKDAAAAATSAEVLNSQMVAFDAEVQESRRLMQAIMFRWPRAVTAGPEVQKRDRATAAGEQAQARLLKQRRLRQAEVDDLIDQMAAANAVLQSLLDRIDGKPGQGRARGQSRARADTPRSDFDRALQFFGFGVGARPDHAALRSRFRELARTMHPDLAKADPESQQAAHGRFVELNRYYELLKLRL